MEEKKSGIKKFFEEFKAFAMRGNVLDMAVGMCIGGAFTAIVTALVEDIINPLIGLFFKADFSDVVIGLGGSSIKIGEFVNSVINFLIVAFVLFVVIKFVNGTGGAHHQGVPLLPERDLHQGCALPPLHLQAGGLSRNEGLKHSALTLQQNPPRRAQSLRLRQGGFCTFCGLVVEKWNRK